MVPKILVTNDDGVYSTGLKAAFDSVSDLGEVTISAPAVQQSGVGRSISIFEPLRITKTDVGGIPAYSVGGTPTDSVILGIFTILKEMPDLVLSGFNIGENISTDTITTSGTIGGALKLQAMEFRQLPLPCRCLMRDRNSMTPGIIIESASKQG